MLAAVNRLKDVGHRPFRVVQPGLMQWHGGVNAAADATMSWVVWTRRESKAFVRKSVYRLLKRVLPVCSGPALLGL